MSIQIEVFADYYFIITHSTLNRGNAFFQPKTLNGNFPLSSASMPELRSDILYLWGEDKEADYTILAGTEKLMPQIYASIMAYNTQVPDRVASSKGGGIIIMPSDCEMRYRQKELIHGR